jgi:DNA-binding CsgD family transcriptional regulator
MGNFKPLQKGAKIILAEKKNCSSVKELAERTGYKIQTVYYYLWQYGSPNEEKIGRKKRILAQLKEGKKQSIIARQNNVSRQYVSKLKKEL